jgi:hypothetical protein
MVLKIGNFKGLFRSIPFARRSCFQKVLISPLYKSLDTSKFIKKNYSTTHSNVKSLSVINELKSLDTIEKFPDVRYSGTSSDYLSYFKIYYKICFYLKNNWTSLTTEENLFLKGYMSRETSQEKFKPLTSSSPEEYWKVFYYKFLKLFQDLTCKNVPITPEIYDSLILSTYLNISYGVLFFHSRFV